MAMNNFELQYKELLKSVINNGTLTTNRTAVSAWKKFNQTLNINLKEGFPIVTGKKMFFDKALGEFKWIYEGQTSLEYLHKYNIFWWDDFAKDNQLGKVYGYQIKHFNGIFDQIKYVIKEIKNNSRRAIISLWNPTDLKEQALPCCYTQFNFVRCNNNLNMVMHFRSSDLFLGLPYDIIVGALFLITIANECKINANKLGLNLADAHIYEIHKDSVNEYLNSKIYNLPILQGKYENYNLKGYKHSKFIKASLVK